MNDLNLQHPEIGWAERTGFPSWCQEVLGEFEEEPEEGADLPEMMQFILQEIPFGKDKAVTRRHLCISTGLSDRQVRKAIESLRRTYVILNDQDGEGYYRSYELADIERSYRQERARALSILYRLQPMRVLLKGGGRI